MVISPFRNRVQFILEAILLSGTLGRLFVAALMIAGVAFLAGLMGYWVALGTEQAFANPFEAIWWAFLRLSDPGYLGDDAGALLRIVSTLVTVAGYVLFMGVLVAILTQGLNERIRKLEMGLTPISAHKHIIHLGWNNRTPWIIQKFLVSEGRVNRFLRRVGARRLKLVVLVDEVQPAHSNELRTIIGRDWDPDRVILRSGSPLRLDHLMRVDYLRAGVILLPSLDWRSQKIATRSDDATVKTILSIAHSLRLSTRELPPPLLVAELYDARKIPTALHSYQGPIEIVAGDEVISRMIAQITRHPHISAIYRELLSMGHGNEIFIRDADADLVGQSFWKFAQAVDAALVIGVARLTKDGVRPTLNPAHDYRFAEDDKIVFVAENWADLNTSTQTPTKDAIHETWPKPDTALERLERKTEKVLILGWSRYLPALLDEYESYCNQSFEITMASRTSIELREEQTRAYGTALHKTKINQVLTDYTVPDNLQALDPAAFDIVICLSSESSASDEDADARTLVAHSILKTILADAPRKPRILVELLDELNLGLVTASECEHLLSPHILGYMLVEVSLRRELNAVFQELFNSSNTEIFFRDFERYGLRVGEQLDFKAIQKHAHRHNEIALGVFKATEIDALYEGNTLNPDRTRIWTLDPGDKFIVLRR